MHLRILPFIFTMIALQAAAQEDMLPHYLTPSEEKLFQLPLPNTARQTPAPPPGPVRTMAEWEQIQALIITWAGQTTILREIVRHAVKECKVLIITTNPGTVSNQLTSAGIPLDSVHFVNAPFNSIWVRDYGPWTVYKNDVDSLYLIDWIYNRPRPGDDSSPVAIAEYLGIPIYEATNDPHDWVHTGGNHLPDGMGTAFSSMLVLEENNDKTEDEIDSIAKMYLGVNNYIKFPTLPYDGIHHLDMHMRIIDEETIIFGEYPEGIADGPQIEANIETLQDDFTTAFGNPYKIVRIPMPPENGRYPHQGGDYRTYTNSIFINKTILVPVYEEKYDTTALRIYRENLPGYNVVGINCNSIIPSLGALHCITKLVGVEEPLMIAHPRLRDVEEPLQEYSVQAIIKHRSGIEGAELYYRIKGDSIYNKTDMWLSDSVHHQWEGTIPFFPAGAEVQYYIRATANNGKEQFRPIVAPEGYFYFRIHGEPVNQPPFARITNPEGGSVYDIQESSVPVTIEAGDPDGFIDRIVIYVNGDSIASLEKFPYEYTWSFPDVGEFELVAKAIDDDAAFILSEPVLIRVQDLTSNTSPAAIQVNMFPNPASDFVTISANEIMEVSISNPFGQKLDVPCMHIAGQSVLDLSALPPGVYFVSSLINGALWSARIVKRS